MKYTFFTQENSTSISEKIIFKYLLTGPQRGLKDDRFLRTKVQLSQKQEFSGVWDLFH